MGKRRKRPETFPPATWRLLESGPLDGPTNLALDEAILTAVASGESPPTLRIFNFTSTTISLGYEQDWDGLDWDICEQEGWHIVRRASDGRAIMHLDDWNYALYLPLFDPRAQGDAAAIARRFNLGLEYGLITLGLDPTRMQPFYHDTGPPGFGSFDGPSLYNIVVGQQALVSGAQWRLETALLYQGTLPLSSDVTLLSQAMLFDLPGQRIAAQLRLGRRAINLNTCLGQSKPVTEITAAMVAGLGDGLDLTFVPDNLTPTEQIQTTQLRPKYAAEAWTKRV
ncbi:MAG: hypothetical protein KJ063_11070 [Anaerolineae bacterium]|nr:hypothetical protein [Anaerolineae bacterium]